MVPKTKGGPRNFDAKTLASIHKAFLELQGNCTKTAEKFGVQWRTIVALRDKYGWPTDLAESQELTREKTIRTVAESNAKTIAALDAYLDKQGEYIEGEQILTTGQFTTPGFDVKGVSEAAKLRALLTGGATDRPDLSSLNDDQLRERAKKLRDRINEKVSD